MLILSSWVRTESSKLMLIIVLILHICNCSSVRCFYDSITSIASNSTSNISGLVQESLHTHNEDNKPTEDSYDALESATCGSNAKEKGQESEPTSTGNLFKNWPLMSSIIVYCVFSLHDMAYTEVCLNPIFSFWNMS